MGEVEARLFAEEGAKVVIADVLVKEERPSRQTFPPARARRASFGRM